MKKSEIRIGGLYVAKVSGKLVTVHIDRERIQGGWYATNTATNRVIPIRSAARLRREANVTKKVEWANRNCFRGSHNAGCEYGSSEYGSSPCENTARVHANWWTGCANLCQAHVAVMEQTAARQGRTIEVVDLPQEGA